jgi:hypothetical protein
MATINTQNWIKKTNGWVFLSHSSTDYENVKIVRDYLEENNFNALMFYLKCLEDNPEDEETQNLIFREIEARNIFVLCKSNEADKSYWVQKEKEWVEKSKNKIYREIDIDNLKIRKCTELSKLDDLMNTSTLFFSYAYQDKKIVDKVYKFLENEGFKIFYENKNIKTGVNWQEKINEAVDEALSTGYFLLFISTNALKSRWIKYDLDTFMNKNANIIPIIVDNIDEQELPKFINEISFLNLKKGRFIDNMEILLEKLKNNKT